MTVPFVKGFHIFLLDGQPSTMACSRIEFSVTVNERFYLLGETVFFTAARGEVRGDKLVLPDLETKMSGLWNLCVI